jgi:mono/diheme cytochrome c family protein
MCHGDNGNGQTDLGKSMSLNMVDFTDGKAMSAKSDGDLFDIIRNGKDKMPPEAAGRANDNIVWNLIIYIRKMSNMQAAAR